MNNLPTAARRFILVLALWALLTGGTVINCSSDPGNLGPDRDPPVAADGLYTVGATGTLTAFMKATDPNGLSLTYSVVAGPGQGNLRDVDPKTGQFTYLPGTVGVDSFSFRASNGIQASNVAVVTIQIFEVSRQAASKPSGAIQVADDPLKPGAMIVLWDDGAGTLQRVYRGQPVPAEILAQGVDRFVLDLLRPGTIRASLGSGAAIMSNDGGYRWTEEPRPPAPCQSEDGPRWGGGGCPTLPQGLSVAPGGGDGAGAPGAPMEGLSLLEDARRAGAWRLAISGPRTTILQTVDDGNSWTVLRELEMGDLRMAVCEEGSLCLVNAAGTDLWRFDAGQ